ALVEPVAARQRADQAVLLERRPVLGIDQLHAQATELLGDLARAVHVPVLLEAPLHDRLADALLDRDRLVRRGEGGRRNGGGAKCGRASEELAATDSRGGPAAVGWLA